MSDELGARYSSIHVMYLRVKQELFRKLVMDSCGLFTCIEMLQQGKLNVLRVPSNCIEIQLNPLKSSVYTLKTV